MNCKDCEHLSFKMAMNMIANAISDGWIVAITEETERLINVLKRQGEVLDEKNCSSNRS